jgi:hypothetical protein
MESFCIYIDSKFTGSWKMDILQICPMMPKYEYAEMF